MVKRFQLFGNNTVMSARGSDKVGEFDALQAAIDYAREYPLVNMIVYDRHHPFGPVVLFKEGEYVYQ